MNHVELLVDFTAIPREIGVDEVDDELGRVHVERDWEAARIEVWLHFGHRAAVCRASLRKQQQLVEHGESRSRRLMYGSDDDQVVPLRNVLHEGNDLE